MPITSSGQIALIADIEAEFDQTGTEDISLFQARDDAGLGDGEIAMTSFYGQSDAVAPTVSTSSATSVTINSMQANGSVSSDGGASITQRGFYFGTSSNYASNTKYSVSGTTGSFNRSFTSLSSSTTYYITAYAINSVGESVGSTVSQATAANLNLGRTTYTTVMSGSATLYYETSGSYTSGGGIGHGYTSCRAHSRSFTNRVGPGHGSELLIRYDTAVCGGSQAYSFTNVAGFKESGTGYWFFYNSFLSRWNASGGSS